VTDLRLLLPAGAAWATAFVTTHQRGLPLVVPAVLALAAVAAAVATTRRPSGWVGTAAVCAAVACAVAAAVVIGQYGRSPAEIEEVVDEGRSVALLLEVSAESRAVSAPGGLLAVDVTIRGLQPSGRAADGDGPGFGDAHPPDRRHFDAPATLFLASEESLGPGDLLQLTATVDHARPGDAESYTIRSRGHVAVTRLPPDGIDAAASLRSAFVDLAGTLPGDGASLLPGLAVGDTSLVTAALEDRMTSASLSHLTAVSGANCALVVGAVMAAFAAVGAPRLVAALAALAGFVVLVTPEPSVVRAATMAAIALLAVAVGRPSAGVPVLCLAVLILLLADPWLSRSFGFALSATATAGLLLLAGPLTRALGRFLPMPVAAALALPLAAQVACQPIIALLDPTLPLWAVPANMLAAPAAPVATVLGMLACVVLPVAPPLASVFASLAWVPSQWIAGVAHAVDGAPLSRLPWLSGVAGVRAWICVLTLVVVLVGSSSRVMRRTVAAALVLAAVAYIALVGGTRVGQVWTRPADWAIAMCDVGQGDAVLVRSSGRIALIDTGPDPAALAACLDDVGVDRVDLLVLTHFDLDHVGGVDAVAGRVGELLHQPVRERDDQHLVDRMRASGARVTETTAGRTGMLGDVAWRVLWPPSGDERYTGNDGSIVVEFGGALDALFLGDLGADSELALLAEGTVGSDYRLVKVAHHGSADQYGAFYEHVGARLALVSCGRDNDYGHPTRSALDLLAASGSTVARTDRDGTTLVSVREPRLLVWTSGPRPAPG
jgi:competence protein ComEC